jgi:hypothetical protein
MVWCRPIGLDVEITWDPRSRWHRYGPQKLIRAEKNRQKTWVTCSLVLFAPRVFSKHIQNRERFRKRSSIALKERSKNGHFSMKREVLLVKDCGRSPNGPHPLLEAINHYTHLALKGVDSEVEPREYRKILNQEQR